MLTVRQSVFPNLRRGQGLVEYALILVLVAIVVIIAAALLGEQIQSIYCGIVMSLDGEADVPACQAPHVTCAGLADGASASGSINVEAVVQDNKGEASIDRVQFFVDGMLRQTEFLPRYCMGTGDTTCDPFSIASLGSGSHTVTAVAYDTDGYSGQCSVSFNIP